MAWKVNLSDDISVDFDDLAPEFFADIADQDTTANWYGVYLAPGGDSRRLYRVIAACAAHAGVEPPPEPKTMRDATRLLDMLERTDDIEDQPFMDGFPPVPDKAESGSASTLPGATDGTTAPSNDSPSDGS
jgi:hypothetical protein